MIYDNILGLIGNTPLVRINRLNRNPKVEIYAKLEKQNPGGSVKDRIALNMVEAAEKSGELTLDKIILEATSGNTGIGLAMVAAVKGYEINIVMSEGASEERKKILKALGAKLILTEGEEGTDGAIKKAKELYDSNPGKYWMPDQFSNPNNPLAHYEHTAKEIIHDVPDVKMFVAGMGTSGTLMGVTKGLKEYNPEIHVIGVEPLVFQGLQGLKNMEESNTPKIFHRDMLDETVYVDRDNSLETARRLAREEGIFVGMSAGSAMYVALQQAEKLESGKIVVLLPDTGERYLSVPDLFK